MVINVNYNVLPLVLHVLDPQQIVIHALLATNYKDLPVYNVKVHVLIVLDQ